MNAFCKALLSENLNGRPREWLVFSIRKVFIKPVSLHNGNVPILGLLGSGMYKSHVELFLRIKEFSVHIKANIQPH